MQLGNQAAQGELPATGEFVSLVARSEEAAIWDRFRSRPTRTGRGADIIILDDILKPDDALSETRRRAANDWYFDTLLRRLNSKENGIIIIVMQRLHEEDLVGEIIEREPWDVLPLSAIAQQDEFLSN